MADAGIFIGFGYPVRGREHQAIQVFNEAIEYYTGLQEEGEIESVEPVFLAPHGGALGGFILLRGEVEKLDRLRESDEFQRIQIRAGLVVDHLGFVNAALGERLVKQMTLYDEQLAVVA
jgi:hypothetical protein